MPRDVGAVGSAGEAGMMIETREVLADAYIQSRKRGRMLSHAVEVDRDKFAVAVLCQRVDVHSLADRCASDPHAEPSCEACQRALRRLARWGRGRAQA